MLKEYEEAVSLCVDLIEEIKSGDFSEWSGFVEKVDKADYAIENLATVGKEG